MAKVLMEHVTIGMAQLSAHPNNPRKEIGDIEELSQSIKKNGIMQNLTVMPADPDSTDPKKDKFIILIGHRRYEAGKKAGIKEFPCNIVNNLTEQEQLVIMLEENMQRSDLTPVEEAKGFQMLLDLGETVSGIAKKTGFSKSTINHRLNIAKLDENIIKKKEDKSFQLSFKDYYELEKIKSIDTRNEVLKNATSSDNLQWLVKREANKETIMKNIEKALSLIAERGVHPAPEEMVKNAYDRSIKSLGMIFITADREPDISDIDLSGECFYYEGYNCIYFIRKKTEAELLEDDTSETAKYAEIRNKSQKITEIAEKMKAERTSFIKSLLEKDIKDDIKDKLWKIIIENEIIVRLDEIYAFLADIEYWDVDEAVYEQYRETVEAMDAQKQMLCIVEQGIGLNIANWRCQYNPKAAESIIELTGILQNYGFSYEDEEEYQVLFGTHGDFIKPEDDDESEESVEADDNEETDEPDVSEEAPAA